MYNPPKSIDFTIASAGTESDAQRVTAGTLIGLLMPAAFTGTTMTIQGCDTVDGTFLDIYDSDGNQVSLVVAASQAIGLSGAEADAVAPFPYIKLVSGSSEAAERTITASIR